jgi:hypothetical protein
MKGLRSVFGRLGAGAVVAICVSGSAYAISLTLQANNCTGWQSSGNTIVLTGCTGTPQNPGDPPPPPPPPPPPTPTPGTNPQPGCAQGNLSHNLGRNIFGVERVQIANGQKHVYCAPLQNPARRVRVEISRQCLGANVELAVTPETIFYRDGTTPMAVQRSSRSANYGSLSHPAGWVPAGTFQVEVTGLPVGVDCPNNKSTYTLLWTFDIE